MSKKLFVGGLSFSTNDEALRAAFASFGAVTEATVVTDRDSGRSRGFGFVTMPSDAEADKAIEGMNGKVLDGRTLNVGVARARANDRDGFNDRGSRNRW
ncbi:MAG: RNA-binding protein [Deltaproteobacteria bacterium]|nr:RNA-binding protein [Deltaproteobacteria bacterium]